MQSSVTKDRITDVKRRMYEEGKDLVYEKVFGSFKPCLNILHVFTSSNTRHIPANQDLDRLTIQWGLVKSPSVAYSWVF